MGILLQISLVVHTTGIVLLGVATLGNCVISKQMWRCVSTDRNKAIVINSTTVAFARLTAIGGALTILSGIIMVIIFDGIVALQ